MQQTCRNAWCSASFTIQPQEKTLLAKFGVPEPDQCPRCRHLHRSMFKETLHFHRRKSDMSGVEILSVFGSGVPFPVYSIDEWWSDRWNAMEYGKDVDVTKPFFPQFIALYNTVPKMANFNEQCENCEYCSSAGNAKNAYYCERVHRSEDMYYSEAVTGYNRDCCDCYKCQRSENLYECIRCVRCHASSFLLLCDGTYDSHFCIDCDWCDHCLFCYNLRKKSFHIFNKPVSREEYDQALQGTMNGKFTTFTQNIRMWHECRMKAIWRALNNINCENCHGDGLLHCVNCYECFDCMNCENNIYCWDLTPSEKNISSMDLTGGGIGELQYNSVGLGGGNYFMRMCLKCRLCHWCTYCADCYYCENCFGCTGLKHKQYCILNKQYTKQEYEALIPKIIEHMKHTMEWGKFFPSTLERFPYNESKAMHFAPIGKEEVLHHGWKWQEPRITTEIDRVIPSEKLPDDLRNIPDDVLHWAIRCTKTGRLFHVIPKELAFYRRMNIPIPRYHPDVRMERRRNMGNPYNLWKRACGCCTKEILTSFAPERPERVYCEECYLRTIY